MWLPLSDLKVFGIAWSCDHWKWTCHELVMGSLQKIQSCHLFLLGIFFPLLFSFLQRRNNYCILFQLFMSFVLFSCFVFSVFFYLKKNVNSAKCEAFSNSLCSITFGLQQCFLALSKIWQCPIVGQPGKEVSEDWVKLYNWTLFDHLTSWKNRQHKQLKPKCLSTAL